jgi:predicted house-cleaning noncanonical NTP pyrophosphatase (MazG superfamily)
MMTAYENEMIEVLPKLVRNNIAQHLLTEGIAEEVEVHSTNDEETYRAMLKSKLMEEAGEVIGANTRTSMQEEIGDLLEVIDALIKTYGLNEADILLEKEAKYERSGGFEYPGTVMTGIRYHGGSK